jgi:predicted outer membrane protein
MAGQSIVKGIVSINRGSPSVVVPHFPAKTTPPATDGSLRRCTGFDSACRRPDCKDYKLGPATTTQPAAMQPHRSRTAHARTQRRPAHGRRRSQARGAISRGGTGLAGASGRRFAPRIRRAARRPFSTAHADRRGNDELQSKGIRMKRTALALTCCALLMPVAAVQAQTQAASTTAANPLPQVDRDFVQAASMSSSTEIDASKLASKNSQDKDVKSFAHHMMLDHTKLTVELKMAAPHGVQVPKDNSDTSALDTLKPLKGKAFDEAYIKTVGLKGHEDAVAAFKKEISDGQNEDLKKLAQKGLPTIEHHYEMAQSLAKKKGVEQ